MIQPLHSVALSPQSVAPAVPGFGAPEPLTTTTGDGVVLSVERIAPSGPTRGAVILCHGLSSNRYAFDLAERSLARHLAARGFDCFLPNLRGAPGSQPTVRQFGLDEYLEQDLPAVLSLVRARSSSERIHWVGHSMGGILFFAYASEHPDVPVARAVTLGSALDYAAGRSVFQHLLRARPLLPDGLVVPFGALSNLSARSSRLGLPLLPEWMNFYLPNVEGAIRREILRRGFGPIPMRLLDDLATMLTPGGLARRGGVERLQPLLHRYRVPTLMLAGSADRQCDVGAVDATARLLSHLPQLRVEVLGQGHGQREHYGHFDLMVGTRAPTEVWPRITAWLEAG